ncbi:MAG: rhamnogalacturonan lyase [Prevotella sp.]|nr:rhamnogalacturonan lyase [Prevotella sp.]
MKKIYSTLLLFVATLLGAQAQNTPVSQMEKLDRGVVAVPVSNGSTSRLISWRLLGTDPRSTRFDVLRNGTVIAEDLKASNFLDKNGNASSTYQVRVKVDGEVVETTTPVTPWANVWMKLPLDRPAGGSTESGSYTYSPNDCSVGDVDGDGEYEIFVKWDPSNSKDNSQDGYTGNVIIDCYKLDGTKLWRIDLGRNIRAGAHYTQFQVYDYDGDGKAEMMCKTAPGSKDGEGNYVNQATDDEAIKAGDNSKVWLSSSGRMDGGHEYLTVFNGLTGKAVNTIAYNPNRNATSTLSEDQGTFNWAVGKTDTHGYNRGDRYLAATAYLDGPEGNPSAIFCRGYYSYAFIWAVDFYGQKLHPRWLSSHKDKNGTSYTVTTYKSDGSATSKSYSGCSPTSGSGSGTMFQNGNHNMSVADVDGDGKDDIIWGSAALKHDGTLRYGTGFGHGDAIHVGAMIPGREGLQVFQVHEEKGTYAWDLHDAETGEIIYKGGPEGVDNGRSMAAQLSAKDNAWWFSSASVRPQYSAATGKQASDANGSLNFRIYWDGTVQDALLDGNVIDKYNDTGNAFGRLMTASSFGPSSTCNSSKNTPNLSADIFGDWREELVLYSVSDAETYLGIYSTNIETKYYVPTLMHDHTYRMGICWQNTAYNQPPHLGYNLAVATQPHLESDMYTEAKQNEDMAYDIQGAYISALKITKVFRPSGTSTTILAKAGFATTMDEANETLKLTGKPEEAGEYRFVVRLTDMNGVNTYDTLHVNVMEATGIEHARQANNVVKTTICDVFGRVLPAKELGQLPRGIYLVREESANGAVETRKVMKE